MADPVHYAEPTFIATVPAGTKLIAVGLRVMAVAPDMAPCWVTPTGLEPINVAQSWQEQVQQDANRN